MQGLDKDQIWAQLELRAQNICKMLEFALDGTEEPTRYGIAPTEDNLEHGSQEESNSDLSSEESDGDSETDEESGESSDGQSLEEEGVTGLRDLPVDEEEEGSTEETRPSSSASPPRAKAGHYGLNDTFFDLKEFNAETEEVEAAFVSNGALDTDSDDIASDEDDIDYFTSIDGQLHADDDHGRPITLPVIMLGLKKLILLEPRYSDFFDAPPGGERRKSSRHPGASVPSKVRFHEEVKVKTIKARGKGLPLSTMQLLDDESDESADDNESLEIESEDEGDDDQQDNTQRHPVNKNSDAVFGSVDRGSQFGGDESSEGEFAFDDGHHTIKRLQDDLLADEDEPDDGMSSYLMSRSQYTYVCWRFVHT